MENKPPLKLKRVHDAERALAIMRAVLRNEEQWMTVPVEWIVELRDILNDQLKDILSDQIMNYTK